MSERPNEVRGKSTQDWGNFAQGKNFIRTKLGNKYFAETLKACVPYSATIPQSILYLVSIIETTVLMSNIKRENYRYGIKKVQVSQLSH